MIAPGEGIREEKIRLAINNDPRFDPLVVSADNMVDLLFELVTVEWADIPDGLLTVPRMNRRALYVELKRPEDFVGSVLSGHLMDQTLSIRESGYNGCTVILGSLDDIYEAIKDASKLRAGKYLRGQELSQAIGSTHLRCKSFRKRSMLNGVPIFWKGDDSGFFDNDDQWKDILELAHDYLMDGDMLGFRQRPANNEREVAAASMMFRGIGSDSMKILLKEYELAFVPRGIHAKPIDDLPGFGPKRCQLVAPKVRMIYR